MITSRADTILQELRSLPPSRNLAEGRQKALRLYRRACQLTPFILRISELEYENNLIDAMKNVAEYIRDNKHLEDLTTIDYKVLYGYEVLYMAQFKYSNVCHFKHYFDREDKGKEAYGVNKLDDDLYKEKSSFAKKFYTTKTPGI